MRSLSVTGAALAAIAALALGTTPATAQNVGSGACTGLQISSANVDWTNGYVYAGVTNTNPPGSAITFRVQYRRYGRPKSGPASVAGGAMVTVPVFHWEQTTGQPNAFFTQQQDVTRDAYLLLTDCVPG